MMASSLLKVFLYRFVCYSKSTAQIKNKKNITFAIT